MAAVGLGGPAEAAVVADVDGAVRADRRAVRPAAEIGDDLHLCRRAARGSACRGRSRPAAPSRRPSRPGLRGTAARGRSRVSSSSRLRLVGRGRWRPRRPAAIVPCAAIDGRRHCSGNRRRGGSVRPAVATAACSPLRGMARPPTWRAGSAGRPTCISVSHARRHGARCGHRASRRSRSAQAAPTSRRRSRCRDHRDVMPAAGCVSRDDRARDTAGQGVGEGSIRLRREMGSWHQETAAASCMPCARDLFLAQLFRRESTVPSLARHQRYHLGPLRPGGVDSYGSIRAFDRLAPSHGCSSRRGQRSNAGIHLRRHTDPALTTTQRLAMSPHQRLALSVNDSTARNHRQLDARRTDIYAAVSRRDWRMRPSRRLADPAPRSAPTARR